MFNLSTVVGPTSRNTQKYRLLYTIKYGTIQPMMKSGILFCAYGISGGLRNGFVCCPGLTLTM